MKQSEKAYKGIDDLPIWNWKRLHEEHNYKYLLILDDYEGVDVDNKKYEGLYEKINREFYEQIGYGDDYEIYLTMLSELTELIKERALTGDKSKDVFIDIKKEDLKSIYSKKGNQDFRETVALLEKSFKFYIDPKKISVAKFYTYIKVANKSK